MKKDSKKSKNFFSHLWTETFSSISETGSKFSGYAKDGLILTAKTSWVVLSAAIIVFLPLQRAVLLEMSFEEQMKASRQGQ